MHALGWESRHAHEHDEEKHDVAHDEVLNRHEHDQGHDRHQDGANVVVEQPTIAVCRPPRGEHDEEPESIGRARHERRGRALVPEPSHDGGEGEDNAVDQATQMFLLPSTSANVNH